MRSLWCFSSASCVLAVHDISIDDHNALLQTKATKNTMSSEEEADCLSRGECLPTTTPALPTTTTLEDCNKYEQNPERIGVKWGGTCTCPDGQSYEVSDNGDSCGSLQCHGGVAGPCQQTVVEARDGMSVFCGRGCEEPLPPATHCPTPNSAFKVCSFWGDPHFSMNFKNSEEYTNHHEWRAGHKGEFGANKMVNSYDLGNLWMFRSKDKSIQSQGFFCDARGHLNSAGAIVLQVGSDRLVFKRPAASAPAWGDHIESGRPIGGDAVNQALELWLNGEKIPYGQLGSHGLLDGDIPATGGGYSTKAWWAQQMSLSKANNVYKQNPERIGVKWGGTCTCGDGQSYEVSDNGDGCGSLQCFGGVAGPCQKTVVEARDGMSATCAAKASSVGPMCAGHHNELVSLYATVPLLSKVYEPVVAFELASDQVDTTDENHLCNLPAGHTAPVRPVSADESLFTVRELKELCSTCGMAATGQDGEFLRGCNPLTTRDAMSPYDFCQTVSSTVYADAQADCQEFVTEDDWYQACIMEHCATEGPVRALVEAEEAGASPE